MFPIIFKITWHFQDFYGCENSVDKNTSWNNNNNNNFKKKVFFLKKSEEEKFFMVKVFYHNWFSQCDCKEERYACYLEHRTI